jgi:hypothetical protein
MMDTAALPVGKITAGRKIRLEAHRKRIQFHRHPARLIP